MSPRALQDLESSKRKLESLEEGLDAYDVMPKLSYVTCAG